MSDADAASKKKRTFRKFTYRGVDLEKLLEMTVEKNLDELLPLLTARARRHLRNGLAHKEELLLKKLRKAKLAAGPMDKPEPVKTHLRNMLVLPEMIGNIVGVYNGKEYAAVEVKPSMVGHYLGEFSISYKPVRHGRPGIGATNSSRFIPLK